MSDNVLEDQAPLLSTRPISPSPDTITKIVKRLRAMTIKLLPVPVDVATIQDPTSRVITQPVVKSYSQAAGDFQDALPYCLLKARQSFMWDANHDPAGYDENIGRAIACEVLARRVVHSLDSSRLHVIMSSRFRYRDWDGDASSFSSALELATDQHCTIFLSSSESQLVVNSLWRGDWVQQNNPHQDIDYIPYKERRKTEGHPKLDPSRLSVPRYQNWFKVTIWLFFLFIYSHAVQEPVERQKDPLHLDVWEVLLYVMGLAYTFEDLDKLYKIIRFFTWKVFGFWNVISLITDTLLVTAFALRLAGLNVSDADQQADLKFKSFLVLSCVSPLIWIKLITVVEGFKYVGTLQICVSRMLQESSMFIALLSVLAIGFAQALYALDAADGVTNHGYIIMNQLIQSLLGEANFEARSNSPVGLILHYLWSATVTVILLNILISLFASAYDDVTDDAEAEFMAFFAEKTIGLIRAPDNYVFPAPFNLLETLFIAPLEYILSPESYATLSNRVMLITFWPTLGLIALFERYLDTKQNRYIRSFFIAEDDGEADDPAVQDPLADEAEDSQISRVPFRKLVESFPNTYHSVEDSILGEIRGLQQRVEELLLTKG